MPVMPHNPAPSRSRPRRALAALTALAAVATAAAVPAAAQAKVIELGQSTVPAKPSCPAKPCVVLSRTSAYQVKIGPTRDLFTAPRRGRIVAWSVKLAAPSAKQIKDFNSRLGGPPSAGITVFTQAKRLMATTTGVSPIEPLTNYLGETVQFPLERTLEVRKGQRVALTVPTWAPMFALGFGTDTSWRASRSGKQCTSTLTQTALQSAGLVRQFRCLYKKTRLTYSVTMISQPHGPKKKPKPRPRKRPRN